MQIINDNIVEGYLEDKYTMNNFESGRKRLQFDSFNQNQKNYVVLSEGAHINDMFHVVKHKEVDYYFKKFAGFHLGYWKYEIARVDKNTISGFDLQRLRKNKVVQVCGKLM
jgi:hypothetical protein